MNVLEDAALLVHGSRNESYGAPIHDFGRTAQIWSAILGLSISAEQVALCMIGVKLSRLVQSPGHRDSVVDVAGYARTYEMVREARAAEQG